LSCRRWKESLTKITKSKKKLDISGILKIDQEYIIKYSQYISYYQVQHSQVPKSCKWVRDCKFPYFHLDQILKFFHINYKSATNVSLNWKHFTDFYNCLWWTAKNLCHFYLLEFNTFFILLISCIGRKKAYHL